MLFWHRSKEVTMVTGAGVAAVDADTAARAIHRAAARVAGAV